jgi:hypothetical protein
MTKPKSASIFFLLALALVPLMPSTGSIWVDEAQTWRYARHTTLADVWNEFRGEKFSEAQMPLGMLGAWSWAQLFGTSEFALRAPNMFYAVGAIFCFYLIGRREDLPVLPLFLAVQPYLWFYVNEARPYALQILGGSLLLLALHQVYRGNIASIRWVTLWAVGAIISSASSMLGAIPTFAFSAAILWELLRLHYFPKRQQIAIIAGTLLSLTALGLYYVKTLLAGSGGAKIWSVGLQNVLFSGIEFLGFAGLLPPRHELRELARTGLSQPAELLGLWSFALPTTLLAVVLTVLVFFWFRHLKDTPRWILACLAVFLGSAILLFLAALVVGFPFWGRHLAPVFPAFVAASGWVLFLGWRAPSLAIKISAVSLLSLLLLSSLMISFAPMHAKDDYRSAAALALETVNEGGAIWWAADRSAAQFYGLTTIVPDGVASVEASEDGAFMANSRDAAYFAALPEPSLVILSKVDVYDRGGSLLCWLGENQYKLVARKPAFSFYKKLADKL